MSMDLMYGFNFISPVSASMSNMLSGSAFVMEYSMTLFGSSASSSIAYKHQTQSTDNYTSLLLEEQHFKESLK